MTEKGNLKGWSEEEIRNRDLMAPCGLYCGSCGIYIATRDGNEKFRAIMANLYGMKPEETECLGCMQPEPPKKRCKFCDICKIRDCVKSKGFYSCHQCRDWPCEMIDNFGFATGVRVMKQTIPLWRAKVAEHGDEEAALNGHGQNANVTIARPAANRFSGVHNVAGPVKSR